MQALSHPFQKSGTIAKSTEASSNLRLPFLFQRPFFNDVPLLLFLEEF